MSGTATRTRIPVLTAMGKPANVAQAAVLNGDTRHPERLLLTGTEEEAFYKRRNTTNHDPARGGHEDHQLIG